MHTPQIIGTPRSKCQTFRQRVCGTFSLIAERFKPGFHQKSMRHFLLYRAESGSSQGCGLDTTSVFRKQQEKCRTELVESYLLDDKQE